MEDLKEKYLQGRLSDKEKKAFEESLTDRQKKDLLEELAIRATIEEESRAALKAQIKGFEIERASARSLRPVWMGIAASLLLLAGVIWIFQKDQASVYDEYFTPYPNYELTIVRGENPESIREEAYAAYDEGNYARANQRFNQLDTLVAADQFFQAISLMQMGENAKALAGLQLVFAYEKSSYRIPAKWYAALVYLKLEEPEKAKNLLLEVRDGNLEFSDRATELLNDL